MIPTEVKWQAAARGDLADIYRWIAVNADPVTARSYTTAIQARVAKLADFPASGRLRPELGAEIRTLPYKRRVLIAYRIHASHVEILRVAYAGRTLDLA